jgi:diguanylate cyclase (GGDEF)-like protein
VIARSPRFGRRLKGGSVRRLLVALVSLPLVAVGFYSGANDLASVHDLNAAARTVSAVRLVTQVDAARTAVEDELLPTLAASVGEDRALAEEYGLSPLIQSLVRAAYPARAAEAKQAAAAAALNAIDLRSAPPQLAQAVRAVREEVRNAHNAVVTGRLSVAADYADQRVLLDQLGIAERSEADRILTTNLSSGEFQALQQLEIVVTAAAAAGNETPAYLATVFNPSHSRNVDQVWLLAWTTYEGASANMDAQLRGTLATAWERIERLPQAVQYDALVDPTTAHGASKPLTAMFVVAASSTARLAAFRGLLSHATAIAITAATSSRATINSRMAASMALTIGLVLASLFVAFVASSAISRPVRRLADEAEQISLGNLVEVRPGGPVEVRTAGEALAATAASLRRIEAQAADLAAGRLDSASLRDALPGPLGKVVHASISRIMTTIHEREALQSELAHQAAHDPLTDLPNRAAALRQLEGALARAARSGHMVGLLFVDLDRFKAVNDTFGHAAGDETLRTVADRMRGAVRAGDVVCRLGGDEFVVVVEDAGSELSILETAHRVLAAVSHPVWLGDVEVPVGVSIGVGIGAIGATDAGTLLGEADTAVYLAKAGGGGKVEVFDQELRETLRQRAELEGAIRDGITEHQFALYYQPIIGIATGTVQGYEALLRWHRPGRGMITPDNFIPVAEQSSLINDLGRWVLFEAIAQLRRWTDKTKPQGATSPYVAINVSGRQLASPQLIDDVADAIATYGVDASNIVLELTETVLVADASAIGRLARLRGLGVRIALDDFGTGYTSIAQLGLLPLDILKIDRSYIAAMGTSNHLVQMMIQVGQTYALQVVAEGVETAAQLEGLRHMNCDAAQGFLFARPQPADQLDDGNITCGVASVATT